MGDWPDWTGETVAIIASGPSVQKEDVELLKGRMRVLAIKRCVELAPWADAVYGCDLPWWRSVQGLPDFEGVKLAYAPKACDEYGAKQVLIPNAADSDSLLFGAIGTVGGGGNSGFQALNLAVQFGAKRILLLGFDCRAENRVHWYGRNNWTGCANPHEGVFKRWRRAFDQGAEQLKARGVEVLNASQYTALKRFPKVTVADALGRWSVLEPA